MILSSSGGKDLFTAKFNGSALCSAGNLSIDSLWAEPIQIQGANLQWTLVPSASSYRIRGNRLNNPNAVELLIADETQSMRQVSGLQCGANYWWQVQGCCDIEGLDCGPWSSLDTFSTRCPSPVNLAVEGLNCSSAQLRWSAVDCADGYELRGRQQIGGNWLTITLNGSLNTSYQSPSILNCNTNYEWQVRSLCRGIDEQKSSWSNLHQFSTPAPKSNDFRSEHDLSWQIYPNPANEHFRVRLKTVQSELVSIKIFDTQGRLVYFREESEFESDLLIKCANWQKGSYWLEIQTQEALHYDKLLIFD